MDPQYTFVIVWRYTVKSDCLEQFENAYASDGDWVQLFRRHPGYIRTELRRSQESPNQCMTIDHWQSPDAFNEFKEANLADYESLDRRMANLTDSETLVGYYLQES
jgi:heme-degrading monooxygenase HmoA